MAEAKNNTLKTALTIGISLVFAAFMWLATRGLNFSKIKEAFVKANYFWVFAAFVFGIMAYWIRAIRWNMF